MLTVAKIIILFFLIIGIDSKAIRKCGTNEIFKTCGSACPPTCETRFYIHKENTCTKQCVRGCFCEEGYYRAKDGTCVQTEDCCQGINEQFTQCGTACPERCDYEPQFCTLQCVIGCACKPEYIRKDNSTYSPCIKKNECES